MQFFIKVMLMNVNKKLGKYLNRGNYLIVQLPLKIITELLI